MSTSFHMTLAGYAARLFPLMFKGCRERRALYDPVNVFHLGGCAQLYTARLAFARAASATLWQPSVHPWKASRKKSGSKCPKSLLPSTPVNCASLHVLQERLEQQRLRIVLT